MHFRVCRPGLSLHFLLSVNISARFCRMIVVILVARAGGLVKNQIPGESVCFLVLMLPCYPITLFSHYVIRLMVPRVARLTHSNDRFHSNMWKMIMDSGRRKGEWISDIAKTRGRRIRRQQWRPKYKVPPQSPLSRRLPVICPQNPKSFCEMITEKESFKSRQFHPQK